MNDNRMELVQILKDKRKEDRLIVLAGNGGSMLNAMHMELHLQERGLRAVALSKQSILTAKANDFGLVEMFAQTLSTLARKGDLFIAISGSGASLNIMAAVDEALKRGIDTCGISFTKDSPLIKKVACKLFLASGNMGDFEDDCSQLSHFLKTNI